MNPENCMSWTQPVPISAAKPNGITETTPGTALVTAHASPLTETSSKALPRNPHKVRIKRWRDGPLEKMRYLSNIAWEIN